MPRQKFDEQLRILNEEMIRMGMLCETAIKQSSEAVLTHNLTLAKTVPELLEQMEQKDRDVEGTAMRILLQQQPVAHDLRYVTSALKMVTDMRRIGVQSNDIAEIVLMDTIREIPRGIPLQDMTAAVIEMVSNCIDAFVKSNVSLAREVIHYDDRVDHYFDEVKNVLIAELQRPEDSPKNPKGEYGAMILDLLMVAKYLERIGDHAVNIAGWVCYSVTGRRES